MPFDDLPDGACVTIDDTAFALRGEKLLRWSPSGYVDARERPRGIATVLTPPSIVGVLAAGYRPQWHPTADKR